MDYPNSTITSRKKGKHLSYEERVIIQIRYKDHYSVRAIAREIDCSPSTISNEIARGSVKMYHDSEMHRKIVSYTSYSLNVVPAHSL